MLDSYALSVIKERIARHPGALEPSEPSAKRAAVAAILRDGVDGADAEILFIRRAEHPYDPWSGHMAFPGGRREEQDASIMDTAIRETREEVGLDLRTHGTLLLRLPEVTATARGTIVDLTVAPFVFAIPRAEANPVSSDGEVAEAIWSPLGPLARGETADHFEFRNGDTLFRLPSLRVGDRVVWGLTYRMLHAFFDALHS